MKRPLINFPLALFLVVASCGYTIVRDGKLDRDLVREIRGRVAKTRGLDFLSDVPVDVQDPSELRRYLEADLEREYPPEDLEALTRVYQAIGLLPEKTDLADAVLRLYTSQVAGFYDPRSDRLYLVDSPVHAGGWRLQLFQFLLQRDFTGEMLLAHELTHALQDQHFQTLALADDRTNDDRALAARAVVEGDATLAGFATLLGGLSDELLLRLVERLQVVPAALGELLPEIPAVLRETLVFQYTDGARFVSWAYHRGGWNGVDALLAFPPASTEQVLWPEKYYLQPDGPTAVVLGGLKHYRAEGWRRLEENTIGELGIRILGERFVGSERAREIARGWDGDRIVAFGRRDDMHLYWLSTWDSERDATEFLEGIGHVLAERYPDPGREKAGARPYTIERRELQVLVLLGVPAAESGERSRAVWEESELGPAPIDLPLDLARLQPFATKSSPRRSILPSASSFRRWASTDFSATGCRKDGTSR